MKYSVRNSLILLFTLLLLVGGGYFYVQNKYDSDIEETQAQLATLTSELNEIQQDASMFPTAQANYHSILYTRLNYPKELFHNHSSSSLYNYLQTLNQGISFTELNYSLRDSSLFEDHGVINVEIRGEGQFDNLVNYLYRLEFSRPLIQVEAIQINNFTEYEKLDIVNFQLTIGAYYRRGDWTNYWADLDPSGPYGEIIHNPYFPLIHEIPANFDNLPDIDNSKLVVLTGNRAHIIDHTGTLKRLSIGDRVYLGTLVSINMERSEAVFNLNRGGIRDRVVLSLQQSTSQKN